MPQADTIEAIEIHCNAVDFMLSEENEVPTDLISALRNKVDLLTHYVELAMIDVEKDLKQLSKKDTAMAFLSLVDKLKIQEIFLRHAMIRFLKFEYRKRQGDTDREDLNGRLNRVHDEMVRLTWMMDSLATAWRFQGAIENCVDEEKLDDMVLKSVNKLLKDAL